jgi:hypothetical protein
LRQGRQADTALIRLEALQLRRIAVDVLRQLASMVAPMSRMSAN